MTKLISFIKSVVAWVRGLFQPRTSGVRLLSHEEVAKLRAEAERMARKDARIRAKHGLLGKPMYYANHKPGHAFAMRDGQTYLVFPDGSFRRWDKLARKLGIPVQQKEAA